MVKPRSDVASIACVAALIASPALGVTYSDGIFDPINWQSALSGFNGNSGTFASGQEFVTGNPDEYFSVYHDLADAPNNEQSGIAVLHSFTAYTYDSAAEGAIAKINLSIDTKRDDQSQRVRFAIIQGGLIYASDNAHSFGADSLPTGWQNTAYLDVLAQDFQLRLPDFSADPSSHPDFSAAGEPMLFGFETSNSTGVGFGGYDTTVLYDNFSVTLVPAPACPGDITGDGPTNSADFNVLASNFGAGPGATLAQGDLTGDGFVNSADFNVLAADFGCGW